MGRKKVLARFLQCTCQWHVRIQVGKMTSIPMHCHWYIHSGGSEISCILKFLSPDGGCIGGRTAGLEWVKHPGPSWTSQQRSDGNRYHQIHQMDSELFLTGDHSVERLASFAHLLDLDIRRAQEG